MFHEFRRTLERGRRYPPSPPKTNSHSQLNEFAQRSRLSFFHVMFGVPCFQQLNGLSVNRPGGNEVGPCVRLSRAAATRQQSAKLVRKGVQPRVLLTDCGVNGASVVPGLFLTAPTSAIAWACRQSSGPGCQQTNADWIAPPAVSELTSPVRQRWSRGHQLFSFRRGIVQRYMHRGARDMALDKTDAEQVASAVSQSAVE